MKNKHGETLETQLHATDRSDVLVIIGHGVTGNMDRPVVMNTAQGLINAGYPVLRFSFSGNGRSEGSFKEATITKEVDDLTAVIDQVQEAGKKLVYVGHSMGGAVGTLFAAKDDRLSALVSLAGMVDTRAFYDAEFGEETPGEGCMWEEEDCPLSQAFKDDLYQIGSTASAAAAVRCPWLLLHGTADDVVLPQDSVTAVNHAKTKTRHLTFEGLGHGFTENPALAPAAIITFLQEHGI